MTAATSRKERLGLAGFLLVALWVLVLFDPHWWLAAHGLRPALRVPTALFLALMALLALQVPSSPKLSRRWQWHAPLLLFALTGVVTLPFAVNTGYARQQLTLFFLYWMLSVGTVVLIEGVRRAEQLLLLYGLSFLWFGIWGAATGLVGWHHSLSNYDAYGAFMVLGVGMCAFLTMAAEKRSKFRYAMLAATMICVVGIVASFARGAFLAVVGIFMLVWARSPRKGATFLGGAAAALVLVIAASVLHGDEFWAEMQSVFSEGTTEGTGEDRWILWEAAMRVFLERPILGVGPRNFGPFAADFFQVGDLPDGGHGYTLNPGRLYGRSLHSIYFQVLSENGTVGVLLFIGILVHFWRRNAFLRSPIAEQRWRELGGRLKLQPIALGLEAAMVGFLINGAFYAVVGVHWFYTLIAANLALHAVITRDMPRGRRRPQFSAPEHAALPTSR